MTECKNFNLGFFISNLHVSKGFELLTMQLAEKTFTFRNMDFEIYRKEESGNDFNIDLFYDRYLKKDTFYNYRSLFYNLDYDVPKGAYGVRKFNFTSYHLQIIYYSLGYYFLDLLQENINKIEVFKGQLSNIKTFYGGRLNFDLPRSSKIYYQDDYTEFNHSIKDAIKTRLRTKSKACIIKLDIKDYYKSIDTSKLLELIDRYSLPSTKRRLKFDTTTKDAISNLLQFINKDKKGLPLSTQNIISNFISYIYLFDLDDYIQKQLAKDNFSYFRYVDDFFIILSKDREETNDIIGEDLFNISTSISNFLSEKLDLGINHLKSRRWIINDSQDYKEFIATEKFISFTDIYATGDSDSTPRQKLFEIVGIISKLKNEFIEKGNTDISNEDDLSLKEVFVASMKNYVRSKEAQEMLNLAFQDWKPILTLNSVKALMFLIGNSSVGYQQVLSYLKENFESKVEKTQNIYLLERFVSLENYNGELDDYIKIKEDSALHYFKLIKRLVTSHKDLATHNIPIELSHLQSCDSLMQQVKMMTLAEVEGKFNLAFNHLLNIYHIYCFVLDKDKTEKRLKEYNQTSVVNFITTKRASIQEVNFTLSFFDRRNKNNISHPGEELMENWVVNEKEFYKYRNQLSLLLQRILSNP